MTNKNPFYKILTIVVLMPVILFALWCAFNVHQLGKQRTQIKKDYSELNNIRYGLLSVDTWRAHMSEIIGEQIDSFDLSDIQEDTLRKSLNHILNSVITRGEQMVNKKQTSLNKKIKQFAIRQLVDVDKVRAKVPEFSQTIINELKKPANKERVKFLARTKFEEFAEKTHDTLNTKTALNDILLRYHVRNTAEFNMINVIKVHELQETSYNYTFALLGCLILFLILWILLRNQTVLHTPFFVMSVLLGLIVLIVSLFSPMIDIDARIKELNFLLIGKPLIFKDQVIFFRSKSILDVVQILITTGKPDSILVGGLILIFSVIFPITKLLCTEIYLLSGEKSRQNKLLQWFTFKSGKWSMADVTVVAIFMAYIGFKGILDTQMDTLNVKRKTLATIATNETSLQPGVLLFVGYVLYGLILGIILKKITNKEKMIDLSRLRFRRAKKPAISDVPKINPGEKQDPGL